MNALKVVTVAMPLRITATTNGPAINLLTFDGKAMLHMRSSGTEAAGTTLDVKIQHSVDGSTNWTDAVMPVGGAPMVFSQVVNAASAGQTIDINIADLHQYIRAVQTLAGSTPAATSYVSLTAKLRKV